MAQHLTHCERCGKEIPAHRTIGQSRQVKYCSKQCCSLASKEKNRQQMGRPHWSKISPGKSGAVAELATCADLLTRGYEVFRSVSQDCSCDLIALKNGRTLRIEIKSGYKTLDGEIKAAATKLDPEKYDVLAIVFAGREILYTPEIEQAS